MRVRAFECKCVRVCVFVFTRAGLSVCVFTVRTHTVTFINHICRGEKLKSVQGFLFFIIIIIFLHVDF